jgi:hypothetical protein
MKTVGALAIWVVAGCSSPQSAREMAAPLQSSAGSPGCGAVLSRAQVIAWSASTRELSQGVCKDFAADGCEADLPSCPGAGSSDFDCIAGRCVWPAPAFDAGAGME